MVQWRFLLTDIAGAVLGELINANSIQVILPLKQTATVSLKIQTDHPLNGYFVDPNTDTMIKAYRNSELMFVGPVVTSQEASSGDNSQIQIGASDAFWRLNYRYLGVPVTQWGTCVPYISPATGTADAKDIVYDMLNYANAAPSAADGFTGLGVGTGVASGVQTQVGPYYFQPVGDAIMQMSAGINTFEWQVVPQEPFSVGAVLPQISQLNVQPLVGIVQPNVVFEYGTTAATVASYSNTIDRSGLLNLDWVEQPAVSDYSAIYNGTDSTSIAARGTYMGLVDNGGVQWDAYRQALGDRNISVRKQARQVLNFVPRPDAPWEPMVDYGVGDQVRCRVVYNGNLRFDAMLRIWGIQFDISPEGNETPTLQLTPPTS